METMHVSPISIVSTICVNHSSVNEKRISKLYTRHAFGDAFDTEEPKPLNTIGSQ